MWLDHTPIDENGSDSFMMGDARYRQAEVVAQ